MASSSLENMDGNCMTLTRWILQEQRKHRNASGDFTSILQVIQSISKAISMAVRKAGFNGYLGLSGTQNVTGDKQQKLDVLSNDLFVNVLKHTTRCYMLVTEENEEPIFLDDDGGNYFVAFDPLDGSSNIDCLASIGSIFAIWQKPDRFSKDNIVLQPGRDVKAAGYILYGSATIFVLAVGDSVNGFTLDPGIGEFILTHEKMKIPAKCPIYSINEGNLADFDDSLKTYLHGLQYPESGKAPYKARYVGSMVADIHRTLVYGGIFMYPGTKSNPEGKLRMLYETIPMSYIVEKAGGMAVTPTERILDITPKSIHQRCPIFVGSPEEIKLLLKTYGIEA